jgi:hypothetical protein
MIRMAYLFHIGRHDVGPYNVKDWDANRETYQKGEAMIDEMEGVIKDVYPGAQTISNTGKRILGREWDDKSYARGYELPNGAALIDLTISSSGGVSWLNGNLSLIGDDGLQGEDGELVGKIRDYFDTHGIKTTEQSVPVLEEVE